MNRKPKAILSLEELNYKPVLTVGECARLTGFGRHTIVDAINMGALKAVRPGKRQFYVNREDLDAWRLSLPPVPLERPARVVPTHARR